MPSTPRLRTFGDLVLERVHEDGSVETVYRAGKLLALLLHLVIRREHAQRRAELADLFWGDEAPEKARASLRQAIASLHRLVGASALLVTRETIQVVAGALDCDRDRFLDAVGRGDVEVVMATYRGPFLASEPRAGSEFERWASGERLRLCQAYLRVMEGAVSEALRTNDIAGATRLARAVRSAEPTSADGVRLLFDALGAGGRRSDARRAIEEFADQVGRADDELPEALAQRLERARDSRDPTRGDVSGPVDAAALRGLGAALVGREEVLGDLVAAAERARLGAPRHLVLVGVTGSGKTRVLDEFESRLRLRGARHVRIRCLPSMRTVPFAALAEIVRALVTLPGAIGVSATTAAVLVEFLPELRVRFPAADPAAMAGEDRVRRRQEAVLDLAAAVSERRAVSLLVDDAQHIDPHSLVIVSAIPVRREGRLALILASRAPVLEGTPGVELLDLPPLSATMVRTMLEEVAPWPEGWEGDRCVERLTATARGLPQVVLQLVRALQTEGLLLLEGTGWHIEDPERLLVRVGEVRPLPVDPRTLSDASRLLLRILSVWGRPVPEQTLRELALHLLPSASEAPFAEGLARIEALGFALPSASTWSIAHDSIAEALRDLDTTEERRAVREALVRWWVAQPSVDLPTLEQLLLLCSEGEDLSLACAAVATVTRGRRWQGTPQLTAVRLANRLAVSAGRPEWEGALLASMGWFARQSRRALAWYAAAMATLTLLLVMVAVLLWPRLRVEAVPLGEVYLSQGIATFHVQPRVGVYNGFGRRLRLGGSVRASAVGGARLVGDTLASFDDGHIQFTKLALVEVPIDSGARGLVPRVQRLRFDGSGLVIGTSVEVRGMVGVGSEGIAIVRATLNGRSLDSTLTARVPVGDTLHFELTLSYTTAGATVNYVVGAGPTWLDPERSVIRLAGLPRPVADAWQTVRFDVPPSARPGHQHLLIIFRAEDSVGHVFSATNWTVGAPVWGDGNDLVSSLSEREIQMLRQRGEVVFERYLSQRFRGREAQLSVGDGPLPRETGFWERAYRRTPLQGTAIEIDFVPRLP